MIIQITREIKIKLLEAVKQGYLEIKDLLPDGAPLGQHGVLMELGLLLDRNSCKCTPELMEYRVKLLQEWLERYRDKGFVPDDDDELVEATREMFKLDTAPTEVDKRSFLIWEKMVAELQAHKRLSAEKILEYYGSI